MSGEKKTDQDDENSRSESNRNPLASDEKVMVEMDVVLFKRIIDMFHPASCYMFLQWWKQTYPLEYATAVAIHHPLHTEERNMYIETLLSTNLVPLRRIMEFIKGGDPMTAWWYVLPTNQKNRHTYVLHNKDRKSD